MKKIYLILTGIILNFTLSYGQNLEKISDDEKNQGVVLDSKLKERDTEIERLKKENQQLTEAIEKAASTLPNNITIKDKNILGDKAVYLFETNRPGKIKITLIQGNNFIQQSTSSTIQSLHVFRSKNLASGESYSLKVEVLDYSNSPTNTKLLSKDYPALMFKTPATELPVINSLKLQSEANTTSASITASYMLETDAYVNLTCYERISGSDKWRIVKNVNHNGKVNEVGKISGGDKISAGVLKSSKFSDLNNNTEYKISIQAFLENGQSSIITSDFITTAGKATELVFSSPVKVKFSPTQSEVTWNYSTKPDLAEVFISDDSLKKVIVSFPKLDFDESKNQVKLTMLSMDDINRALNVKKPVINTRMTKDGKVVEQKFSVSFNVPSSKELKSKKMELGENADKIIAAVEDMEKKKKIRWEDVAKIGLPLLVTLL